MRRGDLIDPTGTPGETANVVEDVVEVIEMGEGREGPEGAEMIAMAEVHEVEDGRWTIGKSTNFLTRTVCQ